MINIYTYINTKISTVINNSDMFNQSCSINYSGKAINTSRILTRVFLHILLNELLLSHYTEINIIESSLITIGSSEITVSEILLDYYYSETHSSCSYIIYNACNWQKMKREQTENDSSSHKNIKLGGYKIRL